MATQQTHHIRNSVFITAYSVTVRIHYQRMLYYSAKRKRVMPPCPLKLTVQLKPTLRFDSGCTVMLPIVVFINNRREGEGVMRKKQMCWLLLLGSLKMKVKEMFQ